VKRTIQEPTNSSDSETIDIRAVRDRLLDKGLIYFSLIAPLALGISLSRMFIHGWLPIFGFHIVIAVTIIIGTIYRRHLSYNARAFLLLGIFQLLGICGLATLGFSGGGPYFLVSSALLTVIAFGTRIGLIVCLIDAGIIFVIGICASTGAITFPLDLNEYSKSFASWINATSMFFFWIPIVIIAYGVVHEHLVTALQDLREIHSQHNRLVDNLGDAFLYRHDVSGTFNYVASSVTMVLGYSVEEFMTHYSEYLTDHPVNKDVVKHTEKAIQGARQPQFEVEIYHKDGSRRWLQVSETPVLDANGNVIAIEGVAHDITENKRTEELLRISEDKYRIIIGHSPAVVWTSDQFGNTTFLSSNVEQIFGYTPEEIIDADVSLWFDRVHPEDLDRVKKAYGVMIEQEAPYDIEYRIQRRDGRWIWLHDTAIRVYQLDGKLMIDGFFLEITDRKQAEEALECAHRYLRSVIDAASHVAIISCDPQGVISLFNSGAIRMLGYSADELVGVKTPEIFHLQSEMIQRGKELTEEFGYPVEGFDVFTAIPKEIGSEEREWTYVRKDGSHLTVSLITTVVRNESGEIIGLLGVALDITERKRADEELASAHRYLHSIIDAASHVAIISCDPQGVVSLFNSGAERMLGYSADELVGIQTPDIFHVQSEMIQRGEELSKEFGYPIEGFDVFTAVPKEIGSEEREWTYVRKDGTHLTVSLIVTIVRNESGDIVGMLGVALDITERNRAAEEIQQRTMRLNALGVLTAGIAHEINNPLASALLAAETALACRYMEENEETVDDCLHEVVRSMERCGSIVHSILRFSQEDTSERHDVGVNEIVRKAKDHLNTYAIRHRIDIKLDLCDPLPEIWANYLELEVAVINLIRNAIQASAPPGSVVVRTRIVDHSIRIDIEDWGCGMDEEECKKMFDPFFSTRTKTGGTGLGASIANGIVASFGGNIEVESRQGEGTLQSIVLPITDDFS